MKKETEKKFSKVLESVYDLVIDLSDEDKEEIAQSEKMETLDYYLGKIKEYTPKKEGVLFQGKFPGCKHVWSEGWGFRVCNVCGQHEEVEE